MPEVRPVGAERAKALGRELEAVRAGQAKERHAVTLARTACRSRAAIAYWAAGAAAGAEVEKFAWIQDSS